jgi:CRP-like cAMP-binding protein
MAFQVPLEGSPFFQGIRAETLGRIAAVAEEVRIPAGAAIFQEGDRASHLYVLGEGGVELTYVIRCRSPITMTIATIAPGEVFGWSALARNETFTGNARAVAESGVYRLPTQRLFPILEEDPAAGYLVMSRLAQIISRRMHDVRTEIRHFLSSM